MCTQTLRATPPTAIRTDVERAPGSSIQRKQYRWDEPIPARVPNIEKDVKTDSTIIGVFLLALGIIGLVGIILYVVNSRSAADISIDGIIGTGIALTVVIVVGSFLATHRARPGVSTAVGIFSGLTTGCLIAFIGVMVVFASILQSCATCKIGK